MKFNHIGIPTTEPKEGEIYLEHLKMHVTDHESNPFGIQWMRFDDDAPYPEIVRTLPHAAFVVQGLTRALMGQKVIIPPNSPSKGLTVAFIEVQGAPIELMEYADTTAAESDITTDTTPKSGLFLKETVEM